MKSQTAKIDLKQATFEAKSDTRKQENTSAIKSANEWMKKNGLPLEAFRQF